MLTCQILIQNNENTIERTLDSIKTLGAEIIIGDIGCTDGTVDICKRRMLATYDCRKHSDLSKLRNSFIKRSSYDWQLLIEPWEILTDPFTIKEATKGEKKYYMMPIMQGEIISYELRMWHKDKGGQFKNPIYEYLDVDDKLTEISKCMIYSDASSIKRRVDILESWRDEFPANKDVIYYEAFNYLSKNEWDKFLNKANQYLFCENRAIKPTIMMKYYMAIVYCHVKKDFNQARKHTVESLSVKPLMAELWCLLGDIYYHLTGEYKKAKMFYRNAITMGSRRLDGDKWPVEILKYKEYPTKMIVSCDKAINSQQQIVKIRHPSI